jgi:hypothetical protein
MMASDLRERGHVKELMVLLLQRAQEEFREFLHEWFVFENGVNFIPVVIYYGQDLRFSSVESQVPDRSVLYLKSYIHVSHFQVLSDEIHFLRRFSLPST